MISALSGCVTKAAVDAPALWTVNDTDGHTMYLFGTYHLATEDLYPLPDIITDAFENSDYLAVEVNLLNKMDEDEIEDTVADMTNLMFYTDGRKLVDDVGEELYERGRSAFVELLGIGDIPLMGFDNIKPGTLDLLLQGLSLTAEGMEAESGVDMYFMEQAMLRDMEILEIESASYQYEVINGFSMPLQVKSLELTLDALESDDSSSEAYDLYSAWRQGDMELLEDIFRGSFASLDDPGLEAEYEYAMLTRRNIGMADKAEEYMAEGKSVFLAVGAAHMAGDGGLVDLLTERGYDVERIN
jgi:uncharacterized protein YbaP (TraB family)